MMRVYAQGAEEEKDEYWLDMTNSLSHIPTIHRIFQDLQTAGKLEEKLAFRLTLICEELFTNIVSYGYRDTLEHVIRIRIVLTPDSIALTITDDGVPFDPLSRAAPDPQLALEERGIGGWGIPLVRTYMDELKYDRTDRENVLVLIKYL